MKMRKEKDPCYKHALYTVWRTMKDRCNNPNATTYEYYGGRGIKVCEEWANSYPSFYKWAISNGYEKGLQIDRFPDNSGNYEPSNCRWTTRSINGRNKRNNTYYTYNGETKTLGEWVELYNVNYNRILARLTLGWEIGKALNTPQLRYYKKHKKL